MITTLEKVKTILQITTTDKDNLISSLIPLVEEDYVAIRKKPFDTDSDGHTIYPPGAEMTAIRMIEYHLLSKTPGVKSESLGDYSVSYEDPLSRYPKSITGSIRKYVSFV